MPCLFVADYGNHRIVALRPDTLRFLFAFGSDCGPKDARVCATFGLATFEQQLFVAGANQGITQFDMTHTTGPWSDGPTPSYSQIPAGERAFCTHALGPRVVRRLGTSETYAALTVAHGRVYGSTSGGKVHSFTLDDMPPHTSEKFLATEYVTNTYNQSLVSLCADHRRLRLYALCHNQITAFYSKEFPCSSDAMLRYTSEAEIDALWGAAEEPPADGVTLRIRLLDGKEMVRKFALETQTLRDVLAAIHFSGHRLDPNKAYKLAERFGPQVTEMGATLQAAGVQRGVYNLSEC